LLLVVSGLTLALIVGGKTRRPQTGTPTASSTVEVVPVGERVPRRLDGVLVPPGEDRLRSRAVMVENHPDARPLSGLDKASVVIEAPVEGGITRFLALFDATTTVDEIGPVRSARPYFVDWADGWKAAYFHVGGSPEALDKIGKMGSLFTNVDEMGTGDAFWRDKSRYAPHNTYTKDTFMAEVVERKGSASTTAPLAWRFQDVASSTAFGDVKTVRVTYGGSYNVTWKFDAERGVYVRWQGKVQQKGRDGSEILAQNIIVTKTDAQVLDSVGRLKLRTTGSGQAVAYRDGKKFLIRWRRSPGEPMGFENTDGSDYVLDRGATWIEVTTDDKVFAGLE
jgi:hypothetical protein